MNMPFHSRAVAAVFGCGTLALDQRAAIQSSRIVALGKARQYRQDFFSLRRAMRILGSWEADQSNAGGWGDLYSDLSIPDAMDLARKCWRESAWGRRSL